MKDLTLIATLPPLVNKKKIIDIFKNPNISVVRYNSGIASAMSNEEILELLSDLSFKYKKQLFVDLKARQLRITKWADPYYNAIELNHNISIKSPAKLLLRGDDFVNIVKAEGNKIWVDPIPKNAVGAGQSVNVFCDTLEIDGYLTENDIDLLNICKRRGIKNIMASFVEEKSDLEEIRKFIPDANIISKIESEKGVEFARNNPNEKFMAARDDLYHEMTDKYSTLKVLKELVDIDPQAICASRIFISVEKSEYPSLSDFTDVELMHNMDYKNFMLCDNVCNYAFEKAINAWEQFIEKDKTNEKTTVVEEEK